MSQLAIPETAFTRRSATLRRSLRAEAPSIAAMALLLVTLTLLLVTAIRSPLKDDVAWLLYVARKWLGGQRLYEDLVEVNPPLIIWIYAIPAAVANWLGAPPRLVASPFFAACVLGSAWWSATLLQGRAAIFARRLPVFGVLGAALIVLPGIEFGQREHLLVIAVLPYLILFARELEGEPEPRFTAIAAGVLGGLGCALKPTYALALVLLELTAVMRGRRVLRIGSLSAFVAMLAYGVGVVLFCPAFLEKAVPLALSLYGGTDTPWWQLLIDCRRLLFGQAIVLALCWSSRSPLARRWPFLRHLLFALLAFAIGASVVFVLQGKNWFYHRLPATIITVLALLLWIAAVLHPMLAQKRFRLPSMSIFRLALPMAAVLVALFQFAQADYVRLKPWIEAAVEPDLSTEVKLEQLIRKQHARTYIAFSEWIGLGFPVVNNTGVTWASRFDSMWALKGELWRARQDGAAPREWPIRRWVARDFIAGCPDLAVVDSRGGINWIAVLVASEPDFAEAWSHYQEIAAFDGLRILQHDDAGCVPPPRRPQTLTAVGAPPYLNGPAAPFDRTSRDSQN